MAFDLSGLGILEAVATWFGFFFLLFICSYVCMPVHVKVRGQFSVVFLRRHCVHMETKGQPWDEFLGRRLPCSLRQGLSLELGVSLIDKPP